MNNSVRLMGDEFVIRENDVLVEMNYIDDIQKALYFYSTGQIKNPYKTILKDDHNVIIELVAASLIVVDKGK